MQLRLVVTLLLHQRVTLLLHQGVQESFFCHGPHELWNIVGVPQKVIK